MVSRQGVLTKIFGDPQTKILKGLEKRVTSINALTEKYSKAGALLRGLRVREGLNQTEFAKIIDTTQANLSSMENGNRPIGKNKAKLIAEKFDVDYRYFL